jgi:hypothetical protein
VSAEQELSVSLPLDSDGFLRRECPTCEREFKWLSSEETEAEAEPIPEGGYYCPYCAIQAPPDAWWTQDQLELVNSVVSKELVEPELEKFERSLRDISRRSGGFISASMKTELSPDADPLVETDDMRRVEFECHPSEPAKVQDDWTRDVHCLICGTRVSTATSS